MLYHPVNPYRNFQESLQPSGNVTVTLGSSSKTVTLISNEYSSSSLSNGFVTFPAVPAGTYTLTATYSGDSNWNQTPYPIPQTVSFIAPDTVPATSSTSISLTPANVDSSGLIAVTGTITVNQPTQNLLGGTKRLSLFANDSSFASITLPLAPVSPLASTQIYTATVNIPASAFPLGTLQVTGIYLGDLNTTASSSAAVPLTVTASDFRLTVAGSTAPIKSGKTAAFPIVLSDPFGVGVPVTLACASPSTAITCAVTPNSATITGTGSATLTINAFAKNSTASLSMPDRPTSHPPSSRGLGEITSVLALAFVLLIPRTRKRFNGSLFTALLGIALLTAASSLLACSGGGSGGSSTLPPPPQPVLIKAPAGVYTVVVTAVSQGITHNSAVTFNIQ